MTSTVAIVEDAADIAEDLEQIVAASPDFRCVCVCRNVEAAVAEIPRVRPDIVIMDISLPDGTGVDCTRALKRLLPQTLIVMFTVHNDPERIFGALAAGADGYLLKRSSASELLDGLRQVLGGGAPMSQEIARRVLVSFRAPVAADPDLAVLSPREMEVLAKLAQGLLSKEIAAELSISTATVNTHLKHIYEKLHVRTRTEAVLKYRE